MATEAVVESITATLEGIKTATEQMLITALDELKHQIDNVVDAGLLECQEIAKSEDKNVKKEARNIVKQFNKTVSDKEKESVKALQEIWGTSKQRLSNAIEGTESVLGVQIKELEKMLKEIIKQMDNYLKECVKAIQQYTKEAQKRLAILSKEYLN